MVDKRETCYVCGGTDTEDGGLSIEDGRWFCCAGCWADYHVGKAALKHVEQTTADNFVKSIRDLSK